MILFNQSVNYSWQVRGVKSSKMKSQVPRRQNALMRIEQMVRELPAGPRKVLLAGLIGLFCLSGLSTLLLGYYVFEPEISAYFATPTPTVTPTPTPQCVRPTLTLGKSSYPLEVIFLGSEGGLPTPGGAAGTAWWVSNTFSPFVFILRLGAGSPDFQASLKPGDALAVQWADCGREEFIFTEFQPGAPDAEVLLAQAAPGMAVIIQPVGVAAAYVIYGQRQELVNPPTPEPTVENAILVDITFNGTNLSAEDQTLTVDLTLTNRGSQAITMTNSDLSLTAEGQQPLSPLSVVPALPQEIQLEGSLSLTITFPNPGGNTAVLRVLDTTVDLYY